MADIAQLDITLRTTEAVAEGRRFEATLDRIDTRARKAATAIEVLRQSLRDAGRQARAAAADFAAADAAFPRRGPGFATTAGLAAPVPFATAPLRTGAAVPVALPAAAGISGAAPESAAAATALRTLAAEATAAGAALNVLTLRATGARTTAAPAAAAPAVAAATVARGTRAAAPVAAVQARGFAGGFLGGPLGGVLAATGGIAIGAGLSGAVDEAAKLETSFNRIVGLAGESRSAIGGLREEVLALAQASGRGPQELAEALFFIESSGFKGAAALEVLASAAQASRAGLGETKTIADAVTSAISTYGAANLSAGEATDVLVAAVREGKGEADALAGVFGRVLPVSAALGVELDETAGALAALTRTGLSADEAATSVRGAMAALLDPSKQATDALARFGLNASELRKTIRDEGLLDGLEEIDRALGGNREALAQVFPEIRALVGVLSLLGENADETRKILDAVADSTGATGSAVAAVAGSMEDSLNRANASLDAAQVRIGEFAAPAKIAAINALASSLNVVANAADILASAFDGLAGTRIGAATQQDVDALNSEREAMRQASNAADTHRSALESLATSALFAATAFGTLRLAATLFGISLGGKVLAIIAAVGAGFLAVADQIKQAQIAQDALKQSLSGNDIERAYRAILDIDAEIGETPIGELAKRSRSDLASLQQVIAQEQAALEAGQAARRAHAASLAAQIESERKARPGIDAAAGAFAAGDIAGAGELAGDDAGFLAAQRLATAQSQLAKLQDQLQQGDAASVSFADALGRVGAALGLIQPAAAKGGSGVATLTDAVAQANQQLETLRLRLEGASRVRAAQLLDAESQLGGGIGGRAARVEATEAFAEAVRAIGDSQAEASVKARALAAAEADLASQLDAIAKSEGIDAAGRLQEIFDQSLAPAQSYQRAIADLHRDLAIAASQGFTPTAEAIAEMEAQIRSNTLGVVDATAKLGAYGEALALVQQTLAATETPSQRAARAVNELNAALATLQRRGVTFDDATIQALEREVKNASLGIEDFDQQVRSATQTSIRSFSEGLSGAFVDTITGAQDAGDAFEQFGARAAAAVLDVMAQILALNAAASAINLVTGSQKGSELLGVEGLGGLFGEKPKADQGAAQQALASASALSAVADPLFKAIDSGADSLAVAGQSAGEAIAAPLLSGTDALSLAGEVAGDAITGSADALQTAGDSAASALSGALSAFSDQAFADQFAGTGLEAGGELATGAATDAATAAVGAAEMTAAAAALSTALTTGSAALTTAATTASTTLVTGMTTGATAITTAGTTAAAALSAAAGAISAAAASLAAAAAAASATSAIGFAVAKGGAVGSTPNGPALLSLGRFPALARGGYVPRLEDGGGARGGEVGTATITLAQVAAAPAALAVPAGPPALTALVGEAGPERLLHASQLGSVMEAAGGDPIRAASLAKQAAVPLLAPEIRGLSIGDIVIPDRKLVPFFERLVGRRPSSALATGGAVVPLHALASGGAVRRGESVPLSALGVDREREGVGDVEVNLNLTQMSGPPVQIRNQRARRSGARVDIFGELWVADVRRGGQGDKEMSRKYALQPQLRDPG